MSEAGGGCVEGLIENPKSGSVAEYTNKSLAGSTRTCAHTAVGTLLLQHTSFLCLEMITVYGLNSLFA